MRTEASIKEAGELEGSSGWGIELTGDVAQDAHHTIDLVDDDLQFMNKLIMETNERRQRAEGPWRCSIFKVPEDIRNLDPEAYEPKVVTIGPYHRASSSKNTIMLALQDHKWHCMRRLLSRCTNSRRTATDLFRKCFLAMKKRDAHVRSCYSEDLGHLSPQDLAWIMFLDASFIIHLLLKFNEDGDLTKMLVLEDKDEEGDDMIMAGEEIMIVLDTGGEKQIDINLVEIAYQLLCHAYPSTTKSSTVAALPEGDQVHHLLHLFHSTLIPSDECLEANVSKADMELEWIPSATELQLAGVEFRKKEKNLTSFLDITFKNGTIEIPQVCLDDHTNTLLRNLVAFEQCHPHTQDYISTYAMFMDYIINSLKDVELLGLNGIIINQLGTNDNAADIFNRLDKMIRHDPSKVYLRGSIWHLKNYYDSKWHRAKLMRDYFNNPWAILSLLAAIFLILLTMQRSFFSAYSYFHRP
ncbi:hypothetical protein J5N97_017991 [Dioscorea zingiberensis]|uniref:Uncharacterized protein n=1 Tax=Dioscorea zingiberensis TaxID=325984 RepID=A0A9D5CMC8_9LILI|nr:hypothetical protein J5N97_017991 [Dioscorea zingiberensis]